MPQLASLNAQSTAVLDLLNTTVKTFDVGAPDPTKGQNKGYGWQGIPNDSAFIPYRVLYPIPGGYFDGTLGDPSDDAYLIYQVTCVGRDARQCEAVVDDTNQLLVERRDLLVIPGRSILRVWSDMAGGGARRDDTIQPPNFIATPRYRLDTTPT